MLIAAVWWAVQPASLPVRWSVDGGDRTVTFAPDGSLRWTHTALDLERGRTVTLGTGSTATGEITWHGQVDLAAIDPRPIRDAGYEVPRDPTRYLLQGWEVLPDGRVLLRLSVSSGFSYSNAPVPTLLELTAPSLDRLGETRLTAISDKREHVRDTWTETSTGERFALTHRTSFKSHGVQPASSDPMQICRIVPGQLTPVSVRPFDLPLEDRGAWLKTSRDGSRVASFQSGVDPGDEPQSGQTILLDRRSGAIERHRAPDAFDLLREFFLPRPPVLLDTTGSASAEPCFYWTEPNAGSSRSGPPQPFTLFAQSLQSGRRASVTSSARIPGAVMSRSLAALLSCGNRDFSFSSDSPDVSLGRHHLALLTSHGTTPQRWLAKYEFHLTMLRFTGRLFDEADPLRFTAVARHRIHTVRSWRLPRGLLATPNRRVRITHDLGPGDALLLRTADSAKDRDTIHLIDPADLNWTTLPVEDQPPPRTADRNQPQ